ncbi:hypothetical protein [Massilia putida]|uniref:hypothetical protein n=1 Tax=Massilia putida TaxID=1141883 RepID=UPI000950C2E3|nr:hypothetical protein [Massilia putida]
MRLRLLALILPALLCRAAWAGPQPLADEELAQVRGADGISFAVRLQLNRPNDGSIGDSRLTIGQTVDGRTTYTVLKNVGGLIQMVGLNISPQTAADGTNYLALTLPAYTRFTDAGFESISVQADPRAPVTQSLGQVTLNGDLQMQGQLRLWSH